MHAYIHVHPRIPAPVFCLHYTQRARMYIQSNPHPTHIPTCLDEDALLVVRVGGEHLLLARRDGRPALHQFRHDAAHRLSVKCG